MTNKLKILFWFAGLILLCNSLVMRIYADAIRSTYAFVASNTIFYPLAWINLISGLAIILVLARELWMKRGK